MGNLPRGSALLLAALTVIASVAWPAAVAAASATVRITDRLDPATVRVAAGTTVVWRNDSGERHRMRSVDHSGDADWDTGDIEPGERGSVRFSRPGTFRYVDERDDDNPAFHGTVIVGAGQVPAAKPASATPRAPGTPTTPGTPATPADPSAPSAATVSMAGRAFSPASVTVVAGGTVTFRNDDDDEHTATASDVSWDSGVLAAGAAFDRSFPTPGTFAFLCLIHPDMQGTVTIRAAGKAAANPPAAQPVAPTPRPAPTATPPPAPAAPDAEQPAQPGTVDVAMVDLAFEPSTVEAAPGTTIRWTNRGQAPHTATADGGGFDSGFVASGDTYEVTLGTPGTYTYACQLHPRMTGSVVVAAGPGSPTGTGDRAPAATASAVEPRPSPTPSEPQTAAPSASSPPIAVADAGGPSARGSGSGAPVAAAPVVASTRAGFEPGRLGLVVLLVGGAMLLFARIVRASVRPG